MPLQKCEQNNTSGRFANGRPTVSSVKAMKREEYITLFRTHDDPVYWEYPPGMVYKEQVARFRQFVSELEHSLGKTLKTETESHIQDASFHSQVYIDGAYLRFSNFGNMVATTDDESIAPATLGNLKELLVKHGYVFVPHEMLEEEYTGDNPGVTGIRDWWIRYFDWV